MFGLSSSHDRNITFNLASCACCIIEGHKHSGRATALPLVKLNMITVSFYVCLKGNNASSNYDYLNQLFLGRIIFPLSHCASIRQTILDAKGRHPVGKEWRRL